MSKAIEKSAFAFRGFDFKNLGRTPELLAHEKYGPIMEKYAKLGSESCVDTMQLSVDLVKRVRNNEEATLNNYHESIALVVAVKLAQVEILETVFDTSLREANMMYGYSLEELSALVTDEVLTMENALKVPLLMSCDEMESTKTFSPHPDVAHQVKFNETQGVTVCFESSLSVKFYVVQETCYL